MAGDISKLSSGKLQCIEKYIYRAVYRNAGAYMQSHSFSFDIITQLICTSLCEVKIWGRCWLPIHWHRLSISLRIPIRISLDNVVHLGKAEVVRAINHVMKKEVQMMCYALKYSVHDVIWKAPSFWGVAVRISHWYHNVVECLPLLSPSIRVR